jgi:alpha-D-ribose 1-methylphosphonate 5-triphosphate synthase subunit PhnH
MISVAALRETRFDPLFAGQANFRHLLEATARPGHVVSLGDVPLVVPPARLRPACAVLLAVLDREVTFHVTGPGASEIRDYLHFNTGSHSTHPEDADFILVTGASAGASLDRARRGTLEAPHETATLVYAPAELEPLAEDADVSLVLSGPGITGERRLRLRGVGGEDFERLREDREFPRGLDLWFAAADGGLCAITGSTRWRQER